MKEYGFLDKQDTVSALWQTGVHVSSAKNAPSKGKGRSFTVLLFAFIVFFLLLLLLIGIQTYSAVNNSREQSDESRLGLSLVANNIRMSDRMDAIGVGIGPEGKSLVMTENLESGTFETRIYLYQGMIVEEYSEASKAYTPERARAIVNSSIFDFEYSDSVVTIRTEQGSTDIALRSGRSA